jgi:hypothetical protein
VKHSMVLELEDDARLSKGGVRIARGDGAGAVVVAAPDGEVRRLLAGVAGQEDVDLGPDLERGRLHDGEEQVPPAGAAPPDRTPPTWRPRARASPAWRARDGAPRRGGGISSGRQEREHLGLHLHHRGAGGVLDGDEVAPRVADRLDHRERRGLRRAEVHHCLHRRCRGLRRCRGWCRCIHLHY